MKAMEYRFRRTGEENRDDIGSTATIATTVATTTATTASTIAEAAAAITPIAQIEDTARVVTNVELVTLELATAQMMMTEVRVTAPSQRETTSCPTEIVAIVAFGEGLLEASFPATVVVVMVTPAMVTPAMMAPAVMPSAELASVTTEVAFVQNAVAVHIEIASMSSGKIERASATIQVVSIVSVALVTFVVVLVVVIGARDDEQCTAHDQPQIRSGHST